MSKCGYFLLKIENQLVWRFFLVDKEDKNCFASFISPPPIQNRKLQHFCFWFNWLSLDYYFSAIWITWRMKAWEFKNSCLWEKASISLAQCFSGLFLCAQSFTFTADSSPTECNAWQQNWRSSAFVHGEKTAHKVKICGLYKFLDRSVDFSGINQFSQILTGIKQWEGHTDQLQAWY